MSKVKVAEIRQHLLKDRGESVKEASLATGILFSTLHSYLSGKKATYSGDHLIALANYFDVTTDFLLSGKERSIEKFNDILTEELFSGWIKIKLERPISTRKR